MSNANHRRKQNGRYNTLYVVIDGQRPAVNECGGGGNVVNRIVKSQSVVLYSSDATSKDRRQKIDLIRVSLFCVKHHKVSFPCLCIYLLVCLQGVGNCVAVGQLLLRERKPGERRC